jgi:hypothetical protein
MSEGPDWPSWAYPIGMFLVAVVIVVWMVYFQ